MKINIFVIIIFALTTAQVSCTKTYRCVCTDTSTGDIISDNEVQGSYSEVQSKCDGTIGVIECRLN